MSSLSAREEDSYEEPELARKRKRVELSSNLANDDDDDGSSAAKKSRVMLDMERRCRQQRAEEAEDATFPVDFDTSNADFLALRDADEDDSDDERGASGPSTWAELDDGNPLPPRLVRRGGRPTVVTVSPVLRSAQQVGDDNDAERASSSRRGPAINVQLSAEDQMQQKHDQFHSAQRQVGLAPPRLERVNGDRMVRPLDTHVQQTNVQAMQSVISTFGWPALSEKDSKIECFWVLRYLENAFGILDHTREKQQAQSRALLGRLAEDDSSEDGDGDDSVDEDERDVPADFRARGPGNKRDYRMIYTNDELMSLDSVQIVYDRLGITRDEERGRLPAVRGNVFNLEQIETHIAGMHSYVLMLKRNLTNHVALFPYQAEQERQAEIQRVYNSVNRDPDYGDVDAGHVPRNINQRLQRLHEKIGNIRVAARALNEIGSSSSRPHGLPSDLLAYGLLDSSNNLQAVADSKKSSARQEVLNLLLQECFVNQYKRCGDMLYKQVKSGSHSTQAYAPLMKVKEFVWRMPDPIAQKQEWLERTSEVSMQRYMEDYLMNVHDSHMLPDLVRSRDQWSFKNGIYTGHNNRFWEYGVTYPNDGDCPFSTGAISARYFDEVFDASLISKPLVEIEVDSVERIMDSQEWPEGVKAWLWICFGRCFYNVGQYDNWQVAPYLKGLAGTGKSTLVDMMTKFYDTSAVGTLSNDMEETFGLMSNYDKDLLVAPEIRPNFKLSQARFQTMVSGERMSIPRKNLSEIEVEWRTPLLLAGNVFADWVNSGGSLARRILPFMFDEPVPDQNSLPDLKQRIRDDLVRVLVKANRYYLLATEVYSGKNIWECVPGEFLQYRKTLREATSNVDLFMAQCTIEQNDVEHYVTLSQFIEAMKAYGQTRNWRQHAINDAEVLRSIKQGLAKSTSEDRRYLSIRVHSEAGKPNEYRIHGLRLPANVDPTLVDQMASYVPPSGVSVAQGY